MCIRGINLDFADQHMFDKGQLDNASTFLAKSISAAIADFRQTIKNREIKFSIIAHSSGSLVAYKAMSHEDFPKKMLSSIYTMGSSVKESQQKFNKDMAQELLEAQKFYATEFGQNVTHFNFHGGQHDLHVPAHASNLDSFSKKTSCPECFFSLYTPQMKNVYITISNNWHYLDWRYVN